MNVRAFVVLLLPTLAAAEPVDFTRDLRPMLAAHCFGCHGPGGKLAAKLDLSALRPETDAGRRVFAEVLDAIRSEYMPPEAQPQPTAEQRTKWVALGERYLAEHAVDEPGAPIVRRLTRLEYNNTVRDLLGLRTDVFSFPERLPYRGDHFRPGTRLANRLEVSFTEFGNKIPVLLRSGGLPGDNRAEDGFTNHASALDFSPLLLEKYLTVADEITAVANLAEASPVMRALLTETDADARARFAEFLERAFRRAVTPTEIDRHFAVYAAARADGAAHADAMRSAVRAVLASPLFLYRLERRSDAVRALDGFELANRLSYFLWSSAPDEQLYALARAGRLSDPNVLAAQARRMLADARSRELSESFAVQWLRLNELFGSQPDRDRFKSYYTGPAGKRTLTMDLLTEALLLFQSVQIENRSILEFLDSETTWLNEPLVRHYGLAEHCRAELAELDQLKVKGDANRGKLGRDGYWFRVRLPDRRRGGVLTTGAVLTLTSTPLRSSPVYRGSWILRAIFDDPPPPPPAAVDELGEDDREFLQQGLTLRAKLELHRRNAACVVCHSKIDHLGFALENFDAVGQWRERYGELPIDATGTLPVQRRYDGPAEFKTALLARSDDFTRAFVRQMFSFAINRVPTADDAAEIQRIVEAVRADGHRFETVVTEIVRSRPFRFVSAQKGLNP